jgi:hypothetical protein
MDLCSQGAFKLINKLLHSTKGIHLNARLSSVENDLQ